MRWFPRGRRGKLGRTFRAQLLKFLVFQKACFAERVRQVLLKFHVGESAPAQFSARGDCHLWHQFPVGESGCVTTRRSLILGSLGALAACTRPKAKGFSGYAFIANQEGGAVAAVDLEVFAVAKHIRVDGAPTGVIARRQHARVYALTPANGSVHEIRAANLTFTRKLQVASSAISMRLS